jgi:FlaA1/EpsC-like NDP-sugar epimerase
MGNPTTDRTGLPATLLCLWAAFRGRRKNILIYGAGSAGLALAAELRQAGNPDCRLVGLIDDDPKKTNQRLVGLRVLGTGAELARLAARHQVERILIAEPAPSPGQLASLLEQAVSAGLDCLTLPPAGELQAGVGLAPQLRKVILEDLLGRKPVLLDRAAIEGRIRGRVVLVTGAAGSIGAEICRQIARFAPGALIGLDTAETPLFYLQRELAAAYPGLNFLPCIGSVTCPDTLDWLLRRHRPTIVYHAAAYKHVSMMESNLFAAVENNIFGTWLAAQAAARAGVEDFVLVSSDKAVRPTSVMGATKRVAELAVRAGDLCTGTRFLSVRFGNVLGSSGSVVPIFEAQIARGGPLTVTHPEMRRYFMTIPEAAQLVLQSSAMASGGEVFVLDMGEQVRIVDLARYLILLAGRLPDRDIEIRFTGALAGEKLHERLALDEEDMAATAHPRIYSYSSSIDPHPEQIEAALRQLEAGFRRRDLRALLEQIRQLVPEYSPSAELLAACAAASDPIP